MSKHPSPKPLRAVPDQIPRPSYAQPGANGVPSKPKGLGGRPKVITNQLKGEALERMKRACAAARAVLEEVTAAVRVGVTTDELDLIAHEACIKRGGYPSPLGYHGFPKSLCTSINEVICHGIPGGKTQLVAHRLLRAVIQFLNSGAQVCCVVTHDAQAGRAHTHAHTMKYACVIR